MKQSQFYMLLFALLMIAANTAPGAFYRGVFCLMAIVSSLLSLKGFKEGN